MVSLVIGGAGFVGRHVVDALLQRGQHVRVLDLKPLDDERVESLVGDICDPADVAEACCGVDTVFQTASLVDVRPGSGRRLYEVNLYGNRNVIAACIGTGVRKLVYTSSVDVVFDGRPIRTGDESLPYPTRHLDVYGRTKMLAEREVLQANGRGGLATCALRLGGVYGPGDPHRFPPVLALARANRGVRLGDGRAVFNHVYVENVAHAHLLAADQLALGSPVAGASYFITDHAPRNFFAFFDPFLRDLGLPVPTHTIPYGVAYLLAAAWELATLAAGGLLRAAPPLTRYVVASTCVDFFFSGEQAARDLGYRPPVGDAEARRRTVESLRAGAGG
ncbi:NAD-dependent epimerase/dehydratase family protein [Chloroflexales bacterium ZM16-3]|nr:NAD-dependent epimerase/dehydratase family protein [Chloroflexales bacterium ZM16-3]